jgi:hypothetical protein
LVHAEGTVDQDEPGSDQAVSGTSLSAG